MSPISSPSSASAPARLPPRLRSPPGLPLPNCQVRSDCPNTRNSESILQKMSTHDPGECVLVRSPIAPPSPMLERGSRAPLTAHTLTSRKARRMTRQPIASRANHLLSRRRAMGYSAAGLAGVVLSSSARATTARTQSPVASPMTDDFAGLIDIGDRSIYMESAGAGSPTVVLIAGALGRGDVWSRGLLELEGARTMV